MAQMWSSNSSPSLAVCPNPEKSDGRSPCLIPLDPPDPGLLPLYESLAESVPPASLLHFRIAQIHMAQGDWTAARQSLATYQTGEPDRNAIGVAFLQAEMERQEGALGSEWTAL